MPCLHVAHEAVALAEDEVVADAQRVGVHAQHRPGLLRGLAVATCVEEPSTITGCMPSRAAAPAQADLVRVELSKKRA